MDSEPRELISHRPHEATSTSEAEHSDTGAREAHMTKEAKPKAHSELIQCYRGFNNLPPLGKSLGGCRIKEISG